MPDPYNPQSLNRYSYCINNPLIYVDPSGYDFFEWINEHTVVGDIGREASRIVTQIEEFIDDVADRQNIHIGDVYVGGSIPYNTPDHVVPVSNGGYGTGMGGVETPIGSGGGSGVESGTGGGNITAPIKSEKRQDNVLTGLASYYNTGKITANGEAFDKKAMTAAMHKIKFGTIVTVEYDYTNENKQRATRSLQVRINDRGPWAVNEKGSLITPIKPHPTRIIDLSEGAFKALTDSTRLGEVSVRIIVP